MALTLTTGLCASRAVIDRPSALRAIRGETGAALLAYTDASAGTWGAAIEVPGTAALNAGGDAEVASVACASAGNCSAGGYYTDSAGLTQAFVVAEVNGGWGSAIEVPGTAALNQGGDAQVRSVSCASVGNCSAGGYFVDGSGGFQGFVVNEVNGAWSAAIEVPGLSGLNVGGAGQVLSVSCAAAGDCSAGGNFANASGQFDAFVVSETDGAWSTAEEVPGTAALNLGAGGGGVQSLSCGAPGDCSAGGTYTDDSGNGQLFVVSQVNGSWGTAEEVPGTAGLNVSGGQDTQLESLSCASAGNCSAGGYYADDGAGHAKAFVVSQVNGTWGAAEQVPRSATLAKGGLAQVFSVSCGAAGNCSAVGNYLDRSGNTQSFVVREAKGTWMMAEEIPGIATLNQGGLASADSVSCSAAGACSAVGSYRDSAGGFEAFTVGETGGTWGTAAEVPGIAALNQDGNAISASVSCASASHCAAGGYYTDGSGHTQAYVVSQT